MLLTSELPEVRHPLMLHWLSKTYIQSSLLSQEGALILHAAGWGKLTRKGYKVSLQGNELFYISFVTVVVATCALVKPCGANHFGRCVFNLAKPE